MEYEDGNNDEILYNIMELIQFYTYYIPALEKALDEDNINKPMYDIKDPTQFLVGDYEIIKNIDFFLDISSGENIFLDTVAYYFDAISHGFLSINNTSVHDMKILIWEYIYEIKKKYNLR
ncbi:hypothetical protein MQX03_19940 [Chryseobacterium aahli]|uniref:hypothetical protein n=1 Tax=Chryseobacterium aahli TaxID=1278643 RepID=UPI001F6148A5|nr:hypothetical protein [Chryseobacterium aahli]MCI3939450.1 hypothetical protein [Chryseobacterium aahli]